MNSPEAGTPPREMERGPAREQGGACPVRRIAERLAAGAVCVVGESVWFNGEVARLTGYRPEEVATLDAWFGALYPGRAEAARRQYEEDRAAGFPESRRVGLRHKGGEGRLAEIAGYSEGGSELWLVRDLTGDARLARLLEQTERAAGVGGWELDVHSGAVYWTGQTRRLHGATATFVPGAESVLRLYTPACAAMLAEAVGLARDEGEPFDLELELADGTRGLRVIGVPCVEEGGVARVCGSVQDITERRRAEEERREGEERRRRLIASSPDCLVELDESGGVLYVSPRGAELLEAGGADELVGTHWPDWWADDARGAAEAALAEALGGGPARFQAFSPTRAGSPRWWDVQVTPLMVRAGQPARLLVAARDMTPIQQAQQEREAFQRNLLQTQKLESLGVLAGGIAHDFNNLLAGILGNADLIQAGLPAGSENARMLGRIIHSAERAAEMCRQMLAYAGRGRFVIEPLDLAALVGDTVQLLQLSISKRATLTLCLPWGMPAVLGDAVQLRQVLMNLVLNASEALGEEDGLVSVSAHAEGGVVCLEVEDTGCGMDEATRARIFEPFFTTKFTGRGLGLAAVQGIVRGHGGRLEVDSRPGQGCRFRVYLPATGAPVPAREAPAADAGWRGEGPVLVVDDDEQVRGVAAEMVRSIGFDPVQAGDGQEALAKVERGGRYRAVLLDLTMPRLDGVETLERLRALDADVPVVLMSGYSGRELSERYAGRGLAGFLQKPFTCEALRESLYTALSRGQGSGVRGQ